MRRRVCVPLVSDELFAYKMWCWLPSSPRPAVERLPRLVNNNSNTYSRYYARLPRCCLCNQAGAGPRRQVPGRLRVRHSGVIGQHPVVLLTSSVDLGNSDIDHILNRCLFKLSPTEIRTLVRKDRVLRILVSQTTCL